MNKLIVPLILCLILTGCTDKVELENRSFVLSMGVDATDDGNFKLTMSIPDLADKSGIKKTIKTATDGTISTCIADVNQSTSNVLDFRHVKVVVFGKKILENEKMLKETMDILQRNKQLSNKIIVLGCDGEASDILTDENGEGKILGEYVIKFYANNTNSIIVTYDKDLMSVLQTMEDGPVIIPKIAVKDKQIFLKNGIIINKFQYSGDMNEDQTRGYAYVLSEGKGDNLTCQYKGNNVVAKITDFKSKTKFSEENGKLVMNININSSVNINEYLFDKEDLQNDDVTDNIKASYEKTIQDLSTKTWDYFAKELNIDCFDVTEQVRKHNYPLYLKYIKGNNDFLKNINFNVKAEVKIDSVGSVK